MPTFLASPRAAGGHLPMLFIAALLWSSGCGDEGSAPLDAQTGPGGPANEPGRHDQTLVSGGADRAYIVYVPESARGTSAAPVVVMLHGASGDGDKFYRESGWREKADTQGLIAVFPTALEYCWRKDDNGNGSPMDPGERRVETIWSSGELGTPATPLCTPAELASLSPAVRGRVDHPLADDTAFVSAMIDALQSDYSVDPARIYISGFSSGGAMASRLAQELSHRLAAIAVNSASLVLTPTPAARPVSVFRTMGDRERAYADEFGVAVLPLAESVLADYPLIQTKMHQPYLTALALANVYTYADLSFSGSAAIRFTYATSTGGASNVFLSHMIEGLAHEYPNGINHPVVMADVLWEFFVGQSLDTSAEL